MRDCIQRHSESMNKKQNNFIHHTIEYLELPLRAAACLPSINVFNQNNTVGCSKTGARTPAVLWTVLPICQDMFVCLQLLSCDLSGSHVDTRWFKYDRDWCGLFTHKSVLVIFEPPCISWSTLASYNDLNRICGNKCKHAKQVLPNLYTTSGQEITVTTVAQKQHCVHILTFKSNIPPRSTSLKISVFMI